MVDPVTDLSKALDRVIKTKDAAKQAAEVARREKEEKRRRTENTP